MSWPTIQGQAAARTCSTVATPARLSPRRRELQNGQPGRHIISTLGLAVELLGVRLDQHNASWWCLDRVASGHLQHLCAAVHADHVSGSADTVSYDAAERA